MSGAVSIISAVQLQDHALPSPPSGNVSISCRVPVSGVQKSAPNARSTMLSESGYRWPHVRMTKALKRRKIRWRRQRSYPHRDRMVESKGRKGAARAVGK